MRGMRMSEMTASTRWRLSRASASTPSWASKTAWPSDSSWARSSFRLVGWSSTMRRFMGPSFRLLVDRVASFGDGGELAGQFTGVDRLQKVGIAPGSQGGGLRILFGIAGDSDDADVAHVGVGLELADQREAVHAWQVEVDDDELRAVFFDGDEGLLGSPDRTDIVATGAQDEIRELEIRSVVLDDEDFHAAPP